MEKRDYLRRFREVGVANAIAEQTGDFTLDDIDQAEKSGDWHLCITLSRLALHRLEQHQDPFHWGMLHGVLGHSLFKYRQGELAKNLELAIYHHKKALEVYTRRNFLERFALNQSSLANAYHFRSLGNPAENLELAIYHHNQALEIYTKEDYPEHWANIHNNLMLFYTERSQGQPSDNLEQAIKYGHQALTVATREADPAKWATIQLNFANVYLNRIKGKQADNLEQAFEYCLRALEVLSQEDFPYQWAAAQQQLASAFLNRILGERAENLELAIYHYNQALEIFNKQDYPVDWAGIHHSLAITFESRPLGDRAENLEQAIHHSLQALEVYTERDHPKDWAMIQLSLGNFYWSRILGEPGENREQAIRCCYQFLEVYTPDAFPEESVDAQINLAIFYKDRVKGKRADNLEQAISCCEQAQEVVTREASRAKWAGIQHNLGTIYRNRILGDRAGNLEQAIYHYQQALEVRKLERSPLDYRQTQRDLSYLYFENGDWECAHGAFKATIEAGRMLYEASYTEAGRRAEVSETSSSYVGDAFCLLHLGRPTEALLRLEQGKTRLLSEVLALTNTDLTILPKADQQTILEARRSVRNLEAEMRLPPETPAPRDDRELAEALHVARVKLRTLIEAIQVERPEFMPSGLDLPELLSLVPMAGALVAPMITSKGSAVFVVPHGRGTVTDEDLVWLDAFAESELSELLQGLPNEAILGGWLGAYVDQNTEPKSWLETIMNTGRALWDGLMGPVHERLNSLGVEEGAPVLLMPQGGLGLLPLHDAWREVKGGKRYFLDDYTVIYAPSGYALSVSQYRLEDSKRQKRSLLVVVNPTADLPFTPAEGDALEALFQPDVYRLDEDEATLEAVVQFAPGSAYLHFSCHGLYVWQDPMRSGLILSNEGRLTLAYVIANLDLSASRLVTLSACETGMIDIRQSPDEYFGLPAGFLQAGAPTVVSTLWAVNDLSTMLLMDRFYRCHLEDNVPPAVALRHAQRWLRNVTNGELSQIFEYHRETAPDRPRMPYQMAKEQFRKYIFGEPHICPFEHPYYWGAFVCSGF
jgi:CHAT domain-containing protein/tetratricopeptide (TPR) repeat protein